MARRTRTDDRWVGPACQLAGLVVLASMFIPGVRQILFSMGILAIVLVGIAIICFFVWLALKKDNSVINRNRENFVPVQDQPVGNQFRQKLESRVQPQRVSAPPTNSEIIDQLRSMDWFQFEKLVGHIYEKHGYNVTRRGGANPDGGIDLIIEKDGQLAAVQCKQWKTWNVGVKAIREFLGALTDAGIQQGIFITLRGYSGDAKQLAEKHGIEIVNETGLAEMLESTDARYDPITLELLNDTRKFCPKCERELVIRTAGKGRNAGGQFWGCSGFPEGCRFTLPID